MQMCQQWKDEVAADAPKGSTVLVNKWLARLTLDVIGEGASRCSIVGGAADLRSKTAAFDFDFGALDNDANEVSEAYNNMLYVLARSLWPLRVINGVCAFVALIPL